jgi:hypothetical protein
LHVEELVAHLFRLRLGRERDDHQIRHFNKLPCWGLA